MKGEKEDIYYCPTKIFKEGWVMYMKKRIVIIGGVAGGTTAATQARRNDPEVEIIIYDKDKDVSYSGCSLPYYIGKVVNKRESVVPREGKYFKDKFNVDVKVLHEVLSIDSKNKKVRVKNLVSGEEFEDFYTTLIIATGASPFVPNKEWINKENVFVLRNVESADSIKKYIEENNPKKALIIGTGFIGMELCENLMEIGIETTAVELKDQIMPPLDKEMADRIEEYIKEKGVIVYTEEEVKELRGEKRVTEVITNKRNLETDMVILSIGIKPNTDLAVEAGVKLGKTKAIRVNEKMETNVEDIYSAGDCAEIYSLIHEDYVYRPLGTTANKMGRVAGKNATGEDVSFEGILSTGIFKIFDKTVAFLGMSEKEARGLKKEVEIYNIKTYNKPPFMKGASIMYIKIVVEKLSERILGIQIIGGEGVDKAIDTYAAAITFGAKKGDLATIDLSYSPPYSTVNTPVVQSGIIMEGSLDK